MTDFTFHTIKDRHRDFLVNSDRLLDTLEAQTGWQGQPQHRKCLNTGETNHEYSSCVCS